MNSQTRVALIGAGGNMGGPIALNLSRHLKQAGFAPLTIWNRTVSKINRLLNDEHCALSTDLVDVGKYCDIIVTCVINDAVARDVYNDLFKGIKSQNEADGGKKHTILVESSTLFPTTVDEFAREASTFTNCDFIAAPIFGPPQAAVAAQLVIVLAGDDDAKKTIADLLVPAVGRKVINVGADVQRASSFKLLGNSVILSVIEVLAESFALAEKTGVGADALFSWYKEFIPAPSIVHYGSKIVSGDFSNGFAVNNGLKDAGHILRLAEAYNCPMPMIDIAHRNLLSARAHGGSDLDWSSLAAGPRVSAGLPAFANKPSVDGADK